MNGLKKNCKFLISRKDLLEKENKNITLKRQAQLLGISRSSIYYKPKINQKDIVLTRAIDEIYTKSPFYGSRRIKKELKRKYGLKASRSHVKRLMNLMGLEAVYPKKRTSLPDKEHKIYPYLLKSLPITKPNQVWAVDITYVRLEKGFAYLVVVMDWFSRYVIDWQLSENLEIDFCLETLNRALNKNTPEIFNMDQGSQFTSQQFTEILANKKIHISMDSVGRYRDNIFVERLWRTVKYENIYLQHYSNIGEARAGLEAYFNFYNNERFHSSLNDQTPSEVYFQKSSPEILKLKPLASYLENSNFVS